MLIKIILEWEAGVLQALEPAAGHTILEEITEQGGVGSAGV